MNRSDRDIERLIENACLDEEMNPGRRQELRNQVLAAYDEARNRSWKAEVFLVLQQIRSWIMSRPVSRAVVPACAVGLLAVVALLSFELRKGYALDDCVAPLLNAKTARCNIVAQSKDKPAVSFKAMFRGDRGRMESEDLGTVMISDDAAGKSLTLDPKQKLARILEAVNRDPQQSNQGGFLQVTREQLLLLRNDPQLRRVSLGERRLQSVTLVGYRFEGRGNVIDIWGDPKTGMPHTVISRMAAFPNVETTMSNFEFDIDLSDELFSLVPPAGYTVSYDTIDLSKPTEADLVAALKQFQEASGGQYPDAINLQVPFQVIAARRTQLGKAPTDEQQRELREMLQRLSRGFSFALTLDAKSDAAYAGKGMKRDNGTKPIFWYRPAGTDKYRILHADLSVIESATPPQDETAQRFVTPGPSAK